MPVAWTLIRGSSVQTFAAALIGDVQRTLVNQAPDTAVVSFSRLGLFEPEPFLPDETIVFARDGVRWFVGHRPETTPAAAGRSQSLAVKLHGPWWYLENTIFMQRLRFVTDPTLNPTVPPGDPPQYYYPTTEKNTATIYIGEDNATVRVNSRDMVLAALAYAIARGAPFQVGTVDAGVAIARQEYLGQSCAQIIRTCLAWTPGQTAWFDYTTSPPTLHIRERANRTLVTLDIADGEFEGVSIARRRGLAENGVRLEYLRVHERAELRFRTLDIDEAGPSPSGTGALIVPIELYGSYMAGTTVVAAEDIPTGLAAILYAAYSPSTWEGSVSLARQECGAQRWTGSRLNIANGNPLWTAMDADIQSATDSTFGGRTELTLGPPKHLGAEDLVALVRKGRTKAPDLVDRLERGGTPGGGITSASPRIDPASQDPTLIFGTQKPEIVLNVRTYEANNSCTGGGTDPTASVWDSVEFRAAPAAVVTDGLSANTMIIGSVVLFHGTTVGRGNDIDYGLVGGTCWFPVPTIPPGVAPPAAVLHTIFGDGTPTTHV